MITVFGEHKMNLSCFQGNVSLCEEKYERIFRSEKKNLPCFELKKSKNERGGYLLNTHYYIGVDWIDDSNLNAIYIEPKLNNEQETDFTKMLFHCLKHTETAKHVKDLYVIKWKEKEIEIKQEQDLLTPFLLAEFLGVLRRIVRKGLKKSYYKVERKLNGRVKGKIQIAKTVKYQAAKQRTLENICTFDVFGIDNQENKVLKKALLFVKRYLPQFFAKNEIGYLQETLTFISPAFEKVSSDITVREIKNLKSNTFFKEYDEGLRLAKLILKRFGYNISKKADDKIKTPPFWIDMSALFELYVFDLLRSRFGKDVEFQFNADKGNKLDYLLNDGEYKMVIDAKYKLGYCNSIKGKQIRSYHEDMRQVSGYARHRKVRNKLKVGSKEMIDCLIIYPDQVKGEVNLIDVNLTETSTDKYEGIYRLAVKLPIKGENI